MVKTKALILFGIDSSHSLKSLVKLVDGVSILMTEPRLLSGLRSVRLGLLLEGGAISLLGTTGIHVGF